jgi:citrate lyase beta subunit
MKRLNNAGVMSILDLEDSAQDPFDQTKTEELKTSSRKNFLEIAKNTSWNSEDFGLPIYVRVNDMSTSFYEEDIRTIIEISKTKFPISGIFLPKVSAYEDITVTHDLLCSADFAIEIVPMIETKIGMDNLELLLAADTSQKFTKVHYGHFDYSLDADLWPFPDPNHQFFWHHITPMIELIHQYKKTYIHTPFPFPKNLELFWASSEYLLKLFPDHDPWICTLNAELSHSKKPDLLKPIEFIEYNLSVSDYRQEAHKIIESFLAGRANKRSFGMSTDRFIPPHQYFAALKFLQDNSE